MEQRKREPANKFDGGSKNRYDLVPPRAFDEVVEIYTYGSKKYTDHNWLKGMSWSRIFGALMRHCWAFWRGEDVDPESGKPHMAHAAWCCLALLEFSRVHRKFDDRISTTGLPNVEKVKS